MLRHYAVTYIKKDGSRTCGYIETMNKYAPGDLVDYFGSMTIRIDYCVDNLVI